MGSCNCKKKQSYYFRKNSLQHHHKYCCHSNLSDKKTFFLFVFGISAFALGSFIKLSPFNKCLLISAYIILGKDVIASAAENIKNGSVFNENFLMSVATIGAILLGELSEAVFVMLFYDVGEYLQEKAVAKSKSSITDILGSKKDTVHVISQHGIIDKDPNEITLDTKILIRQGERLALDGFTLQEGTFDFSPLTGESLPKTVSAGTIVPGGVIAKSPCKLSVVKEYKDSAMARIIRLTNEAIKQKSPTESFVTRFSKVYTPIVVAGAAALAFIPPVLGLGNFNIWIYRALTFLVISCPCALVLSVPAAYFTGIWECSKKGILVKGGIFLDTLSEIKNVVFDKTGTLTKSKLKVSKIKVFGTTEETALKIAGGCELCSSHPIAKAILSKCEEMGIKPSFVSDYKEINGKGITALYKGKKIILGKKDFLKDTGIVIPYLGFSVYLVLDKKVIAGFVIEDEIKQEAYSAIKYLKNMGIKKTIMLSGDLQKKASLIGEKLSLDESVGELLPWEKAEKLKEIKAFGKTLYAGDGINDAPALATADVSVAMGGLGSDAAIEAANIVIMDDNLKKIVHAIDIAKGTKKLVQLVIYLALAVKFMFLILGGLGLIGLNTAVFADVGVAVASVVIATKQKSFLKL